MEKIIEKMNRILAYWNPLEVPENIALDEYKGYIPYILRAIGSRQQLTKCLEDILMNKLGTGYNSGNKEHQEDLQRICNEIIQVYRDAKALNNYGECTRT